MRSKRQDVPFEEESSQRLRIKSAETSIDRTVHLARDLDETRRCDGIARTRSDPRLRDLRREEYHKRSNSDKWSSVGKIDDMTYDPGRPIKSLDGKDYNYRARPLSKHLDNKTDSNASTISKVDDDMAYYSSSSSVISDVRSSELRDYSSNHSSYPRRHILPPSSISPYQGVDEKVGSILISGHLFTPQARSLK